MKCIENIDGQIHHNCRIQWYKFVTLSIYPVCNTLNVGMVQQIKLFFSTNSHVNKTRAKGQFITGVTFHRHWRMTQKLTDIHSYEMIRTQTVWIHENNYDSFIDLDEQALCNLDQPFAEQCCSKKGGFTFDWTQKTPLLICVHQIETIRIKAFSQFYNLSLLQNIE